MTQNEIKSRSRVARLKAQHAVDPDAPIFYPEHQVTTLSGPEEFMTDLEAIQNSFQTRRFTRWVPKSDYPEMIVTVPDEFDTIELAPLYDVHVGSDELDEALLDEHLNWIARTPNVLTWNGGDAFENKTQKEAHMGHDALSPEEQLLAVTCKFAKVQHKMLFAIPGNHEDRTFKQAGMSSAKRLADNLRVPFFSDYAMVTILWRGNHYRILAHHGAGGGATPGAQRNAARKEMTWYHPDLLWTGHVHQQLVDPVKVFDRVQATNRIYERDCLIMISPSYVKYFGGYAAHNRLAPGQRGLAVVILNQSGRMDASIHARGERL